METESQSKKEKKEISQGLTILTNKQIVKELDVSTKFIAEMKAQADSLTIEGLEDKDGYQNVYNAHQTVKKTIASVKKKKTELIAPLNDYKSRITEEAKRLEDLLSPIRDNLGDKRQVYEDLVEAEREKKRLEKKKLFDDRILMLAGLEFVETNGTMYYCGNASIEVHNVGEFTDEEFQERYDALVLENDVFVKKDEERKAEEKRIADEEEKQRLADLAELEALRKEKEARDKADEKARLEKERIEAEEARKEKQRLAEIERSANASPSGPPAQGNDPVEGKSETALTSTADALEAKVLQQRIVIVFGDDKIQTIADELKKLLSDDEVKKLKKLL